MNIGELKEKIRDLPDDMLIGGSGFLGEYLECNSVYVRDLVKSVWRIKDPSFPVLCFDIDEPGDEPD